MKKILFIVLIAVISCAACSTTQVKSTRRAPNLSRNLPVYVAVGKDKFPAENRQVQQFFVQALSPYLHPVFTAKKPLDLVYMGQVAQVLKTGYMVYPEILQWEDHNTPWTTVRDKVSIRITLIDAKSQRILYKEVVSGKSSLWRMRNEKPDVVAQELIEKFVTEIYEN